jgi:hypothetical protein
MDSPCAALRPSKLKFMSYRETQKLNETYSANLFLVQALHLNLFWSFQLKRNVLIVRKIVANDAICNS